MIKFIIYNTTAVKIDEMVLIKLKHDYGFAAERDCTK